MPAFIALDRFGAANGQFSRGVGAEAIIKTGERICAHLPKGTPLYRHGGDSFAVLFAGELGREEAPLQMEEIRRI